MHELGRWLETKGLGGAIAATCARHAVPLFVPAAPDGPLAEGYRTAAARGPVVDFFRDYAVALAIMDRFMAPGPGTGAVYPRRGRAQGLHPDHRDQRLRPPGQRGASPHMTAIQITTDNTVFGGLGGARVGNEAISWGKESPDGLNVMVFADVTIALPLLCQGLLERYGPDHAGRRARPSPPIARGDRAPPSGLEGRSPKFAG